MVVRMDMTNNTEWFARLLKPAFTLIDKISKCPDEIGLVSDHHSIPCVHALPQILNCRLNSGGNSDLRRQSKTAPALRISRHCRLNRQTSILYCTSASVQSQQ